MAFIVDFPYYPKSDDKYWPGVKGAKPWDQWAKEQAAVPITKHIDDPDFKRIFMNCFKFMGIPLPELPHSPNRLIDVMFKYCRSLEKLYVEKTNIDIDRFNSSPLIPQSDKLERLYVADESKFEVPIEGDAETKASTTQTVWGAFAVQHPGKSQERIVRLYQLPSMLVSFGLDTDETMLLRKCYAHRWMGIPQQWQSAAAASAGPDSSIAAIDVKAVSDIFLEILSASTSQGPKFGEEHFHIYQKLCSMTINFDVFSDFVLSRILAEIDIDDDKHIDLKESQRLLERMGYPCSFELVKNHYCNVLKKASENELPTLFDFDQVKLLLNSIRASAVAKVSSSEPVRSSFGSDVGAEIMSRGGDSARAVAGNEEMQVLIPSDKIGDKQEAPLPPPDVVGRGADMFSPAAETEKEDDDVMPYMRERATINESLDHPKYIGPAPFSTFRLLRGQKKGGFFAKLVGGGEEVEAGVFKGCVTLLAPKGSELQRNIETAPANSAIRRIFPVVPTAPIVDVKNVVVRLYVLKGYNMCGAMFCATLPCVFLCNSKFLLLSGFVRKILLFIFGSNLAKLLFRTLAKYARETISLNFISRSNCELNCLA